MSVVERLVVVVVFVASSASIAQCTKDTDCKGDRVCSVGACVDSDAPRVFRVAPEVQRMRFQVDVLKAQRSSLVPPIVTLALALVSVAVGFGLLGYDSSGLAGYLLLGVGASLGVSGGVGLGTTLWGRGQANEQIRELERLIADSQLRIR